MKKIFSYTFLSGFIILLWYGNAFCFDEQFTHPDMTKKALDAYNLDAYLKQNLGLIRGIDTVFPLSSTDTVKVTLAKGSTNEDVKPTMCRASNHFHDPTKSWNQAGLSGYQGALSLAVNIYCSATPYTQKYSNLFWATNYLSPGGPKGNTNNDMNWDDIRTFYKNALTAPSNTGRELNFVNTFLGLGHVLHLIQDMAVPAHVRNDFRSHFNFTLSNGKVPYASPFELYVKLHRSIVTSITDPVIVSPSSLTDFWDSDKYDESKPLKGYDIGLAEYANANFASEYTILSENKPVGEQGRYPYPRKEETTLYVENMNYEWKGWPVYRAYLSKSTVKGGEALNHFAVTGRHYRAAQNITDPVYIEDPVAYLGFDDNVHKDYADKLVPRAVGYSAGLLNYFFRAELDMQPDAQNAGEFVIQNKSFENMSGTFTLYYDDKYYNRRAVDGVDWTFKIGPGGESVPVSFTVPTNPAPGKMGEYMLVFEGKLGNEENAVVGKVVDLGSGWSYLLIKQTDFTTDEYSSGWIDAEMCNADEECKNMYLMRSVGGLNTSSVKFDLKWLGEGAEITNVTFISYNNYYCYDYSRIITADFDNLNGHSIILDRPSKGSKGSVEFIYNGKEDYSTQYPKYILVDAINKNGQKISFFEPLFSIHSNKRTRHIYTTHYEKYLYFNAEGVDVIVNASLGPINCMTKHTGLPSLGRYEIDRTGWTNTTQREEDSFNFFYSSINVSSKYFYSTVGEHHYSMKRGEDAELASVSLPNVQVKIKRTWSRNATTYLESLGYSGIQLPEWEIILNGGI